MQRKIVVWSRKTSLMKKFEAGSSPKPTHLRRKSHRQEWQTPGRRYQDFFLEEVRSRRKSLKHNFSF